MRLRKNCHGLNISNCGEQTSTIPFILIKVFMYQLFRSLAYLHSFGICHRNVKLENLLVNPESGVLKLCDFGSVKPKSLIGRQPNISYMYSKNNYLAPELILGSEVYTTKIDMWSAGCVLAELLLGKPIFSGECGVDCLVEAVKICGTPSLEEIREMNPKFSTVIHWPQIKPRPWQRVFHSVDKEAIDLISRLIVYAPSARISPLEACAQPFFDQLRDPNTRLPNGRTLPSLFNFTQYELCIRPSLKQFLLPCDLPEYAEVERSSTASNICRYG